jgi:8-oxo-dGTP diphosphatase
MKSSGSTGAPRRVADIDWQRWRPVDRGTLVFVVRDGHVLLIHKKRGLGAGKINGPGGRVDDGERPIECAVREVREELQVTPTDLSECGELQFQFVDGYSIHVWVFRAADCLGSPVETEEAMPLWTPINAIPYDQMWSDDRIWLPLMLERRPFLGRFVFDGDQMLDHAMLDRRAPLYNESEPGL